MEQQKPTAEIIDRLEGAIVNNLIPVDCPVIHRYTPGLYIRQMAVPAGTLLTSKIHKTEHPFIVTQGKLNVWVDGVIESIEAPYFGITKPGTRRVIYAIADSIWTTFHANPDNEDQATIEERIIEKHDNKFLDTKEMEALCHL